MHKTKPQRGNVVNHCEKDVPCENKAADEGGHHSCTSLFLVLQVINHPAVDAVWICSPSQYHAQQIKACALAGKHVFCEKPIATDLAETIESINYCREAGVKLMIALQRRFDANFARVKRAILQDEVSTNGTTTMMAYKGLVLTQPFAL